MRLQLLSYLLTDWIIKSNFRIWTLHDMLLLDNYACHHTFLHLGKRKNSCLGFLWHSCDIDLQYNIAKTLYHFILFWLISGAVTYYIFYSCCFVFLSFIVVVNGFIHIATIAVLILHLKVYYFGVFLINREKENCFQDIIV